MLDSKTYQQELIRMWDSLEEDYKGYNEYYKEYNDCCGLECEKCPLHGLKYGCDSALSVVEMYNIVEKWSKEHPQTYNVSKLEYDILKTYIKCCLGSYSFSEDFLMRSLLKEGYFQGANEKMNVEYYFNHCEVVDK